MNKITRFVIDRPKTVIIAAILMSILLGSGIPKLRFEEDIKDMIPKEMPSRQTLNELEEIFGGSDTALIGIGYPEKSVFNVETLKKIKAISDSLDVMPGINRVNSLATIKYMEGHDWGLEVTPYLEEEPETDEDAERIRQMFFRDSTYVGIMVSEDGNFTSIIAQVSEDAEISAIYQEIKKLVEPFEGPEEIYLAGTPVVQTIISSSIKGDLRRLIPFVLGLISILLFVSFRSMTGVLLPLAAVVMSAVSMLGLMGHIGLTFTTVNNIMPIILLGIGIDYGIHVLSHYYQEAARLGSRREAVFHAITDISTPMFMACITTMAGFLSLLTSPLDTHHDFGYMLAFGVFAAMVYNMTFVPAFLSILPMPKTISKKNSAGFLSRILDSIGGVVLRFRFVFAILGILMAVISALGIPKVNIEMNPITFFPEDSEVVRADMMVNENLSGSVNMNLLFEGNIQSEKVMNQMDELQDFIETYPEVGSTISLATIVKKINKSLNNNDPFYDKVPDSDAAVAQAILMYETSGDPSDFENIVDNSFEYGQVVAMLRSASTQAIARIATDVEQYANNSINGDVDVSITGFSVFFKDVARLIVTSQMRSISFAVVLVFLIAWGTYKRFLLGLLSVIPLTMCVMLNFGLMGYFGIDLSIPMAMIASMIIGIGVDFSFHLISRYKKELKKYDNAESVKRAINSVGEPILYSALTTACGGMVLLISSFVPVVFLGFLLALIMVTCAFLALTVLASSLTFIKSDK